MKINRHQIREIAFQTLFALNTNPEIDRESFYQALTDNRFGEEIPEYLVELVDGVTDQKAILDETITGHLHSGWSLNRLAKVDLIILELAIYEMHYVADVPSKVSLNEAVELTKKFSDDQSRKFVNGVLSSELNNMEK